MVHNLRFNGLTKKWVTAATCLLVAGSGMNSAAATEDGPDPIDEQIAMVETIESSTMFDELIIETVEPETGENSTELNDVTAPEVYVEPEVATENYLDTASSGERVPLPVIPGTPLDPNVVYGNDEFGLIPLAGSVISGQPYLAKHFTSGFCAINHLEWNFVRPANDSVNVWCQFSPVQDSLSYQWYRNGEAILGATTETYTGQPADLGQIIEVRVTAGKLLYEDLTVFSINAMQFLPQFTYPAGAEVYISGPVRVGQLLTANPPTYTPAPSKFEYQWYRIAPGDDEMTRIPGGVGKQYRVQDIDEGQRLAVMVTVSHVGYYSAGTMDITNPVTLNTFTGGKVTISGTRNIGEPLKMNVSGFSPTPTEWQYQWYRGGVAIPGAIYSTYKPVAADAGKNIVGKVTVGKIHYYNLTRSSDPVSILKPIKAGKVTISGPAQVGGKLAANPTGFAPTPSSYLYQWYRNGVKIAGATTKTYVPTTADVGKKLTVEVTGKLAGYTNSPIAKSAATKAVSK